MILSNGLRTDILEFLILIPPSPACIPFILSLQGITCLIPAPKRLNREQVQVWGQSELYIAFYSSSGYRVRPVSKQVIDKTSK